MTTLPWAHGGPSLRAELKSTPDDFIVEEILGFAASGSGEHDLLKVRKRETNTDWLANQLAAYAGVKSLAVGFAGMKDRQAVTTQSFSVQLPGQDGPDWKAFPLEEVQILSVERHNRKLKRGALQGNRFEIVLRKIMGDQTATEHRLKCVQAQGVPNYFGEQRFGLGGGNVERALAMFDGRRVDRNKRGMLLSAARSHLFNAVLAARVEAQTWNQGMPGEVYNLNGSRSWFTADAGDESLLERLRSGDIHPSGPLWGRGELPSTDALATLETGIVAQHERLQRGLEQAGLDQERRALRLIPSDMSWEFLDARNLKICFCLPAGSYATVVLREIATWE